MTIKKPKEMSKTIFMILCMAAFVLCYCYSYTRNNAIIRNRSLKVKALKYDPSDIISVSLSKPLGLVLEEVEPNEKRGVFVGECSPDGRAKASGKITRGQLLLEVNGIDVRNYDFDSVMDILIDAPVDKTIELILIDAKKVQNGPANLSVKLPDGRTVTVNSLKGQNMRRVLLDAGIDLYGAKGFANCGGGGSCGLCAIEVQAADWEPRQDFESRRLKKYSSSARLACNTIIEGDAVVVVGPSKAA